MRHCCCAPLQVRPCACIACAAVGIGDPTLNGFQPLVEIGGAEFDALGLHRGFLSTIRTSVAASSSVSTKHSRSLELRLFGGAWRVTRGGRFDSPGFDSQLLIGGGFDRSTWRDEEAKGSRGK
jgi:hypothetical protein